MSTDVQLLEQYVSLRDAAAFRDMVERHGPLVLHVCRQVLRDPTEIDDAFQATFLVLVRKAPSIRDPARLSSWLYGVAFRVATRAKRRLHKRTEHERRRAEMSASHSFERPWDDLQGVLREELERLPVDYRSPIELCYVQGLTHEEASARLGSPLGTVKTRLVRGRKLLQERLSRRGIAPGLAVLLLLLLSGESLAAVPEPLSDSTVEAMRLESSGARTALAARFPGAHRLAGTMLIGGRILRIGLILLALVGTSLGALGAGASIAAVFDRPDRARNLPAALTDILNIDCR
ncbi:MAG: sigma-70 family RNA polymerase sigma factor [Isosphaeraceae bacterium]|nr:sigma-70 family RNA polymerase sigma factor [Isosphaeraceae bacterium]